MAAPAGSSVRDWAVLAAMGFFGVAAYTILLHLGLRHSTAANAALLIPTTQPVFTALLGAAVLGERPPAKLWLGLGLGLVGAILVISHDAGGSVALSSNVLIVLSAFAFSCYAVSAKFSPDRLDSLETTTLSFGFGMVFLLPMPFLLGEPVDLANASTTFWLSIAYLAIFATLLAYLWWNQAVKALGASRTGIFTFLMPPFAVALAALVLGHAPTAQQILGGCLALGGVACRRSTAPSSHGRPRDDPPPPARRRDLARWAPRRLARGEAARPQPRAALRDCRLRGGAGL